MNPPMWDLGLSQNQQFGGVFFQQFGGDSLVSLYLISIIFVFQNCDSAT